MPGGRGRGRDGGRPRPRARGARSPLRARLPVASPNRAGHPRLRPMTRVCVVGAGTMGRGIAAAIVADELHTTLADVDEGDLERMRAEISFGTNDLECAVGDADA